MHRYLIAALALLLIIVIAGCEDNSSPDIIVPAANRTPVIESITTSAESVLTGHPVTLIGKATDADLDSLYYSWYSQSGGFIGRLTDTLAIWTPPYPPNHIGTSTIYLDVNDGTATTTDSIQIICTGLDDRMPRVVSPEDGDPDIDLLPTLAWQVEESVQEDLTYDVYMAHGSNLLRVAEALDTTAWQVDAALDPGTSYRWRIAARPTSGEEIYSAIYDFSVISLESGAPLGNVLFRNYRNLLGTWTEDRVTYIERVGRQGFIHYPGRIFQWNPGTPSDTRPALAVYNTENGSLYLVDENGQNRKEISDVIEPLYGFSFAGTLIAFVRPGGGTSYELMSVNVPPTGAVEERYAEINAPWVFSSRPCYSTTTNTIAIALVNSNDSSQGRLTVFSRDNDEIRFNREKRVWSPQFDPTGSRTAWLEMQDDGTGATHLFLGNGTFVAQDSLEIVEFGSDATDYAWSPNGMQIAMFANITSGFPKILTCDVVARTISEVTITEPIVLPTNMRQFVRPEWNAESTEFTVCVQRGEKYALIAVTPSGATRDLVTDLTEPTYADWR